MSLTFIFYLTRHSKSSRHALLKGLPAELHFSSFPPPSPAFLLAWLSLYNSQHNTYRNDKSEKKCQKLQVRYIVIKHFCCLDFPLPYFPLFLHHSFVVLYRNESVTTRHAGCISTHPCPRLLRTYFNSIEQVSTWLSESYWRFPLCCCLTMFSAWTTVPSFVIITFLLFLTNVSPSCLFVHSSILL